MEKFLFCFRSIPVNSWNLCSLVTKDAFTKPCGEKNIYLNETMVLR